jgi:hypothetical protein
MANLVQVRVCFDAVTAYGPYSDALCFSPEEYSALSAADIEALKAARVASWEAQMEAARNAVPVSPDPVFQVTAEDGTVINV